MTNNNKYVSLKEAADVLKKQKLIVICGHNNPDSDCIGSQVMCAVLFESLNIKYINILANTSKVQDDLSFLYGTEKFISSEDFDLSTRDYCFLQLDLNDDLRMGKAASKIKKNASCTVTLDHHISFEPPSNYSFCDNTAAANAVIIYRLYKVCNVSCTKEAAFAGYTALMGDTGSFRQQNTNSESLKIASEFIDCGADANFISNMLFMSKTLASIKLLKILLSNLRFFNDNKCLIGYLSYEDYENTSANRYDSEGFIDVLRSLKCCDVVCLLTQEKKSDFVKVSIRSKNDLDVNAYVTKFGGGGHKAAAGFTVKDTNMFKAVDFVENTLKEYISQSK